MQSGDFNPGIRLKYLQCYGRVSKTFCEFFELPHVIAEKHSDVYEITENDNEKIISMKKDEDVLYVKAARAFLKNDNRPREDSVTKAF